MTSRNVFNTAFESRICAVLALLISTVCCLTSFPATAADVQAKCAQTAIDNNLVFNSISTEQSGALIEPPALIETLAAARVVVIGETHDKWVHHLTQLEVICQMAAAIRRQSTAASKSPLAIGLEQFQLSAQQYLDAYIDGGLSLQQMLQKTNYFDLWGFDFRLYAPIIEWARENKVRLLALNADTTVVDLVRDTGFEALTDSQRATLPFEIETRSDAYIDRLKKIFSQHSSDETDEDMLRRFLQVQQTWDATMSATAYAWVAQNPQAHMVILAGSGHTIWRETIPDLLRNKGVEKVVSLAMNVEDYLDPEATSDQRDQFAIDYRLQMSATALTPSGRMGVALKTTDQGVVIDDFGENSAALAAGIEAGDRLLNIDGQPIETYAQVRQLLWQAVAGDSVEVEISRDSDPGPHTFTFELR